MRHAVAHGDPSRQRGAYGPGPRLRLRVRGSGGRDVWRRHAQAARLELPRGAHAAGVARARFVRRQRRRWFSGGGQVARRAVRIRGRRVCPDPHRGRSRGHLGHRARNLYGGCLARHVRTVGDVPPRPPCGRRGVHPQGRRPSVPTAIAVHEPAGGLRRDGRRPPLHRVFVRRPGGHVRVRGPLRPEQLHRRGPRGLPRRRRLVLRRPHADLRLPRALVGDAERNLCADPLHSGGRGTSQGAGDPLLHVTCGGRGGRTAVTGSFRQRSGRPWRRHSARSLTAAPTATWSTAVLLTFLAACAGPAAGRGRDTRSEHGTPGASAEAGGGTVELLWYVPAPEARPSTACETPLCRSLVEVLDGARERVDLAVYGVRGAPAVVEAVDRARQRGVTVRGVVDRTPDGTNIYRDTDAFVAHLDRVRDDGAYERKAARARAPSAPHAPRCPRPPGTHGPVQCLAYDLGDRCLFVAQAAADAFESAGAIMHNKFAVADRRRVWTGSANVSDSGIGGYNANVVLRIDDAAVGARYADYFEDLLAGRFHEPPSEDTPRPASLPVAGGTAEVFFAPRDRPMTRGLRPVIRRARERIDVAVFFLTHKHLTQDLIDAHLRGVDVRVVLDASGARNAYSKHWVLRAAGIPVKVENFGGKMHMKATAVDGEVLVAGSMNYTSAGERTNDENVVVLRHPALARRMHEAFESMFSSLPEWTLEATPDPESRQSGASCEDGADNDHDGRIDGDDPGCRAPEPPTPPILRFADKGDASTCSIARWPATATEAPSTATATTHVHGRDTSPP
ncbi:MAG: hypothetical protein D6705_11130 [Deltaproteobacteria bacterium]|nr:MAG: hypothetical protein D6705_11130 [Deltaproteobacteria bacterium]